jgi:hypothetical protein
MHLLPLEAFGRTVEYDIDRLIADPVSLLPLSFHGARLKITYDGIFQYSTNDRSESYVKAFRQWGIEVFDAAILRATGALNKQAITPGRYEPQLRKYLNKAIAFLQKVGANPPFALGLSLLGVEGSFIAAATGFGSDAIEEDELIIPERIIRDTSQGAIDKDLKTIFDRIWNAAGFPASQFFNKEGVWQGRP